MSLHGISVLVTGAGRGIGRAVALALAREGARLTLVARTASELEAVAREAEAAGGRAVAFVGDLRTREACDGAVARAVDAHGKVQVLVNNAGVGEYRAVAETSDEDWDRIIGTNLTAVFRLTRAALPHLTREGGHIFMISSLAGANPIPKMAAYCASKAALDHFPHCLMLEVRHQGVKVTTIAPGSVDTGFGGAPGERNRRDADWMLKPEDIATCILDLLHTRPQAHLSRIEMRPSRPPQKA
jgi:3-oxoacyl-[acyl-carrier protein] reductase